MENAELLQAIRQIVREEIEPVKQDVLKIQVTLENDISKKLSALHEGHMLNTEKLEHISDTVDDIESSVVALDIMNKVNTDEIIKLKFIK